MNEDPKARLAASVRDTLLTIAKAKGEAFDFTLTRYSLTDSFATDSQKRRQWKAFLDRATSSSLSLAEVVETVRKLADPLFAEARLINPEELS